MFQQWSYDANRAVMVAWTGVQHLYKPQTIPPVNRVPIGEAQYFRAVQEAQRRRALGDFDPSRSPGMDPLPPDVNPHPPWPYRHPCEFYPPGKCPGYPGYDFRKPPLRKPPPRPLPVEVPPPEIVGAPEPTPEDSSDDGGFSLSSLTSISPVYLVGGAVLVYFLMKKK